MKRMPGVAEWGPPTVKNRVEDRHHRPHGRKKEPKQSKREYPEHGDDDVGDQHEEEDGGEIDKKRKGAAGAHAFVAFGPHTWFDLKLARVERKRVAHLLLLHLQVGAYAMSVKQAGREFSEPTLQRRLSAG